MLPEINLFDLIWLTAHLHIRQRPLAVIGRRWQTSLPVPISARYPLSGLSHPDQSPFSERRLITAGGRGRMCKWAVNQEMEPRDWLVAWNQYM